MRINYFTCTDTVTTLERNDIVDFLFKYLD